MAAHAVASVTITFGLVSIPVKLYSAIRSSEGPHFNLLHAKDGSRLRQEYVCIKEDVVVPRSEMVKGYEFAKDEYVVFTKDELKALEAVGTQEAHIGEFLPLSAIDPVFYEKSYYMAPDRGGAKTYALLHEALTKSNRVALGRYAARGKEHIVLIRAVPQGLTMEQLFYAEEMRGMRDLEIPEVKIGETELKLATQLVEQLARDEFEPQKYHDEVRERIEAAVQQKIAGKEVTIAERPKQAGQVIDLMDALRASLGKRGEVAANDEAPRRAPARPSAAARKPAKRAPAPADLERATARRERKPAPGKRGNGKP